MGLDAQVIAIGPFSRRIASALEYGEQAYEDVEEGAVVISNVFIGASPAPSRFLARCFGVGEWELGRHLLNKAKADLNALRASDFADDVPRFERLRDAGFEFYYLPNG